jgi:hypothetical protein
MVAGKFNFDAQWSNITSQLKLNIVFFQNWLTVQTIGTQYKTLLNVSQSGICFTNYTEK